MNATIEDYKLFRKNRQGRTGRSVAVYVERWTDFVELPLRHSHDRMRVYGLNLVARPIKAI